MPEGLIRRVDKYDGQLIYKEGKVIYDLGNYLGGGAAGSVYQGIAYPNEKQVAVKVLKPVGFKLLPSAQLRSCNPIHKGKSLTQEQVAGKANMAIENIWWLIHPTTKQFVAAYEDPLRNQLRELTLPKCVEIWGWAPLGEDASSAEAEDKRNISQIAVNSGGNTYHLPLIAPKYMKWLRSRHKMCREMATMMRVGEHPNIVELYEVLELIQDDKTTLFLVLELVQGGELFDRIKASRLGSPEEYARKYFVQLLSGIEYCHHMGVCHRDLKPENLLLSDLSDSASLKIADFGLSELIYYAEEGAAQEPEMAGHNKSQTQTQQANSGKVSPTNSNMMSPKVTLKRLKSVVGSPHYVAPEITTQDANGYEGRPVDMWSAGVILYSMLTGSLPFEEEVRSCARYKRFLKWIDSEYTPALASGGNAEIVFPSWFFPPHLSASANSLMVSLLHYDPTQRLSAAMVLQHPWCLPEKATAAPSRLVEAPSISPASHSLTSSRSQSSDCEGAGTTPHNSTAIEDNSVSQLANQLSQATIPTQPVVLTPQQVNRPQEGVVPVTPPQRRHLPDQDAVRSQQREKEAAEKAAADKTATSR